MNWDFFIAHSSADAAVAERLYSVLHNHCRVFLDTKCVKPGDDWDAMISRAQRESKITVVLVSENTDASYYQREEIAAAIAMARANEHRIVPIFVHPVTATSDAVPYGLRLKHGLPIQGKHGLNQCAIRLVKLFVEMHQNSEPSSNGLQKATATELPDVEVTASQVVEQTASLSRRSNKDRVVVELRINADFDKFSQENQDRLLDAIGGLLRIGGDIRVISKRRGSVLLKIELTAEQSERLIDAVKAGALSEFGVVDAVVSVSLASWLLRFVTGRRGGDVGTKNDAESTRPEGFIVEKLDPAHNDIETHIIRITDINAFNDFRSRVLIDGLIGWANGENKNVIFDLSNFDYLSSSGVANLVHLKRRLESQRGRLVLMRVSPVVADLLAIMRLNKYFSIADGEREACRMLIAARLA